MFYLKKTTSVVYVRASNSDGHTYKVISEPVYRIYSLKVHVGMGSKYTRGSDVSTKADRPERSRGVCERFGSSDKKSS